MKYFRQNRMAYAFCASHFENSKQLAQILYPFGTGKPIPNQSRLSSSPMLSGSLTHATLLLPSEMFNRIPQSLGLEEHPQSAYFTGNVVCWKCSWLYETVDWLRCTLRLINLTLRSTPSTNKNVTYKNISVFTSPVRDLSRAWVIDIFTRYSFPTYSYLYLPSLPDSDFHPNAAYLKSFSSAFPALTVLIYNP